MLVLYEAAYDVLAGVSANVRAAGCMDAMDSRVRVGCCGLGRWKPYLLLA